MSVFTRDLPRIGSFTARYCGMLYCIHAYGFEVTQCSGPSMAPTMNPSGDLLFIDKLFWRFSKLERNDIVIAHSPHVEGQSVCKRVLGLENDVVRLGSGRRVWVPPGHVWIEGDNAKNSTDSRYYGPVPVAMVQGRVASRIWPPHQIKLYRRGEGPPAAEDVAAPKKASPDASSNTKTLTADRIVSPPAASQVGDATGAEARAGASDGDDRRAN